ncbi:MAG: S9 family peptidase [Acidimicrobiales bacterium]
MASHPTPPDPPAPFRSAPGSAGAAIRAADVAHAPAPGMSYPTRIAFSADDTWLTYLHNPEGGLTQQLFVVDLASGDTHQLFGPGEEPQEELSLDEQLRKERARELAGGVTRYWWAEQGERLLIPSRAGLHLLEGPTGEPRAILDADSGPVLDPRLAPDGSTVAFGRDGDIYLLDVATSEVRRITESGDPAAGITYGLAEFIAQEEMDRQHGMWWSKDAAWLAFTEVDESGVAPLRIAHLGSDLTGDAAEEVHRYPFVGEANARVRLGVVRVGDAGGRSSEAEVHWLDLGPDDAYLARVDWTPDGRLVAQVESRGQRRLDVWRFDPASADRERIWVEEGEPWINLHDMFHPLDSGGFIWASERTGYRHLWLHDPDGTPQRQLTEGDWVVDSLEAVDEATGRVWFCGNRDDPRQRHLYEVSMGGSEPRRLTPAGGYHQVLIDHGTRRFTDTASSLDQPPSVTLRDLSGGEPILTIHDSRDTRIDEMALHPPKWFTTPADDGSVLYGAYYAPAEVPAPTVVSVYGGPHVQRVIDDWSMTANLGIQRLRALGLAVVVLDNRGSARRGLGFEGAVSRHLGDLEVADQVAGVQWAAAAGITDPARVGITGWSYGGYMSALCLARAPDVFSVAVAGAPVTSWDGYDTHYTERYMGTPADNPAGYESSSVMTHVGAVRGHLMLVHGLVDENVHFRHTARLVQALVSAGFRHELLIFPEERHMPRREEDRAFLESRRTEFFLRHLMGSSSPD